MSYDIDDMIKMTDLDGTVFYIDKNTQKAAITNKDFDVIVISDNRRISTEYRFCERADKDTALAYYIRTDPFEELDEPKSKSKSVTDAVTEIYAQDGHKLWSGH